MSDLQKIQPLLLIFLTIMFFLPTLIGLLLRRNFKETISTNIMLGFTWVGWLASIAWSISGDNNTVKKLLRKQSYGKKILMMAAFLSIEIFFISISLKKQTFFSSH